MTSGLKSQAVYISPSIGVFLNQPINQPKTLIGYEIEVGYCFANEVNAGISQGSLDMINKTPFIEARTGYTFLERKTFSFSACGGVGYVFKVKQLIGEADLSANIHLPKDFDFAVTAGLQAVYTIGFLPSVNVGFTKSFSIPTSKKKK